MPEGRRHPIRAGRGGSAPPAGNGRRGRTSVRGRETDPAGGVIGVGTEVADRYRPPDGSVSPGGTVRKPSVTASRNPVRLSGGAFRKDPGTASVNRRERDDADRP